MQPLFIVERKKRWLELSSSETAELTEGLLPQLMRQIWSCVWTTADRKGLPEQGPISWRFAISGNRQDRCLNRGNGNPSLPFSRQPRSGASTIRRSSTRYGRWWRCCIRNCATFATTTQANLIDCVPRLQRSFVWSMNGCMIGSTTLFASMALDPTWCRAARLFWSPPFSTGSLGLT